MKISNAVFVFCWALLSVTFSQPLCADTQSESTKLYQFAKSQKAKNLKDKILVYSKYFIGRPYNFDLGDFLISWDQDRDLKKLADLTSFDCLSFVETVLSLAMIDKAPKSETEFYNRFNQNLAKLMFGSQVISYETRNHFFDTEWILNNQSIVGANLADNFAFSRKKSAKTNKFGLLQNQIQKYAEKYIEPEKRQEFNNRYSDFSSKESSKESTVSYVSFQDYLEHETEIVRKSKNKLFIFTMILHSPKMLELTHSEHNIGHVGFVFWKNGKLYLRHSSSTGTKSVVEIPLSDFAREKQSSKIFPGFSLYEVRRSRS